VRERVVESAVLALGDGAGEAPPARLPHLELVEELEAGQARLVVLRRLERDDEAVALPPRRAEEVVHAVRVGRRRRRRRGQGERRRGKALTAAHGRRSR
jgi:hypothetical protein